MTNFQLRISGTLVQSSKAKLTGREVLELVNLNPPNDYELLIKINEKGFEPVQLDEVIDLRSPGIEGFQARPYKKIIITVDDEPIEVEECFLTPNAILRLVKKEADTFFLNQKINDREIGYRNDPEHRIGIKSGQKFYTFQRLITIYVNATPEEWSKDVISFEEVVKLAFPQAPYGIRTEFQVLYSDAQGGKDGRLVVGQSIKVKNGTKFDVTATDKA